jgi:uncharacterized repeat protein (TIGR03833 family)
MIKFYFKKMTSRKLLKIGDLVSITLKCDQGTDKLTVGRIAEILTNSANHPRGIKVRLTSGQVGRVQKMQERTKSKENGLNNEHFRPVEPMSDPSLPSTKSHITLSQFMPELDTGNDYCKTWNCRACTYINGVFSTECEMCGSNR